MKRKTNKKGFTLVEVIIAMSVFAIISTGFIMAASYAYKAQTKAKKRLTISNEQTTNLEGFTGMVDPEYAGTYDEAGVSDLGVRYIGTETSTWVMTYDFKDGPSISNNRIRGFISQPNENDKVFQLTYFSPNDKVALDAGEYWVTIKNDSSDNLPLLVKCDGTYTLFNNEKKLFAGRTSMPPRLIPPGYTISFGVKDSRGGYFDDGECVFIFDCVKAELGEEYLLGGLNLTDTVPEDYNYVFSYDGSGFTQITE